MTTITEFLNARLDEDEAAAAEAAHGSADWAERGTWWLEGVEHNVVGDEEAFCHPSNVNHIVRHDPARVLREVAMKRDLLALHRPGKAEFYDGDQCDHCAGQCHSSSGLMCEEPDARYPCDTVRTLATVHSDHPDYQPEWAP